MFSLYLSMPDSCETLSRAEETRVYVLRETEKEIFPFSKYRSRHLKPVDLSLRDSGCPRDVDVATSHEQTTTIEGLPSSHVTEQENEGEGREEGRASYTISYRAPASIRLLVPRRVRSHGIPLFLSREAHLFLAPSLLARFSSLPPKHARHPRKILSAGENFRIPQFFSFVHVRR